jgi:GH35 family endo-1,4-beta-xylanase
MKLGTIVSHKYFNGMADQDQTRIYQQKLVENFKNVGMLAFGQMPLIAKGPDPEKDYNFRNIDCLVEWGQKNNIEIQYNTVINSHHNSFPDWYYLLPQSERKAAIKRHVQAIVGRYKEKIKWFKLVNEARPYSENYLETGESRGKLIADIFKWAKEVYPAGIFVLNDHIPFLKVDEFIAQYENLLKEVISLGVSIDKIGIEGHVGYKPLPFQLPNDEEIKITLDRIHSITNLPIYITEFDLSYDNAPQNPAGVKIDPNRTFSSAAGEFSNWFEYQAYAYKHFYDLLVSTEYVEGLTFWGYFDGDRLPLERPGTGFFDVNLKPKPNLKLIEHFLNLN